MRARHVVQVVIVVSLLVPAAFSQQRNTVFATLAVNAAPNDVLNAGPTEAEIYTDSNVTYNLRGLGFQFFALVSGSYRAERYVQGSNLIVDIADDHRQRVLINGFESLALSHATTADGTRSYQLAFDGRRRASNGSSFLPPVTVALQAIIGNPTAGGLRMTSSAAALITLHSGYTEFTLEDDGFEKFRFLGNHTFKFYGEEFGHIYVAANGYASFTSPSIYEHGAPTVPGFQTGCARIAPFFADFDPTIGGADMSINASQFQVGEDFYVRIRWQYVPHFSDPLNTRSFSIVLEPYGVITIETDDAPTTPSDAIIGITPGDLDTVAQNPVGPIDLSARLMSFDYLGDMNPVFEHFYKSGQAGSHYYDLPGATISFYPDSAHPANPRGYHIF